MRRADFAALRVQVVGANSHAGALMRGVLAAAGVRHVVLVEDSRRALELLASQHFDAVFVEGETHLKGIAFARSARRKAMRNPLIPIFAVHSGPKKREVENARDLGVSGLICRPLSPKTVADKLQAALTKPRPFISAADFFGPDRRTKARTWRGRERRQQTPRKETILVVD